MNFLLKAWAQTAKEFHALSMSARVTAGLLLAVIVVSLGYLLSQQVSRPDAYLLNGDVIAGGQLPTLEAAFAKAGLSDYQIEGGRIKIPRGKISLYMAALADAGALPPDFGNYFDQMLKQSGVWVSGRQQEEMIKVARQHELALIIQSMKGYERASVLYDIQKKTGLHGGRTVTASVNVKPVGNQTLERDQVESLRNLLAGAIAGLDPRHVAVTDLNSGRTYYASADDASSGSDSYVTRKREYERLWSEKIRQSLGMIPSVIVTVNVELDSDVLNERTTVEFEKPTEHGAQTGPLFDATAFARRTPAAVDVDQAAPGTRRTTVHKVPLRPLRATVAVGIPSSYIDQVWHHRHAASSTGVARRPDAKALATLQTEIVNMVEAHVRNLLPNETDNANSRLSVTATVFQDVAEKTVIAEPEPSTLVLDWIARHDGSLALGAVAIISMLMLRSLVRLAHTTASRTPSIVSTATTDHTSFSASGASAPSIAALSDATQAGAIRSDPAAFAPPPPAALKPDAASGAGDALNSSKAGHEKGSSPQDTRRNRPPTAKSSVRDQLADMVRDDPDAAARILRNWIGSAG